MGPDGGLEIWVDEMAPVEGAADGGGGEVESGREEVGGEEGFFGGGGFGCAVWEEEGG